MPARRTSLHRARALLAGLAAVIAGATIACGDDDGTQAASTATAPSETGAALSLRAVRWTDVVYPIECGGSGWDVVQAEVAEPAAGTEVAAVLVACKAGGGSPPRTLVVYDRASSPTEPHLVETLWQDGRRRLSARIGLDGSSLTLAGGAYSSDQVPRCCPDRTFTASWQWRDGHYVAATDDAPPYEPFPADAPAVTTP